MDFWLLDVKSTIGFNGNDVAFDYINTYFEPNEAIKEAKLLSKDRDVLSVSVHHWVLKEDGAQEHTGEVVYSFVNRKHREIANAEMVIKIFA